MAVADIAAKHGLALPVVLGLLRSPADSCSLSNPYECQRASGTAVTGVHVYWLGYIAACGRLFGQDQRGVLVLSTHRDDLKHVETLLADLVVGHASCEYADSNLHGRQAYVRNPGLVRVLRQWGIGETRAEGSVSLEYVPRAVFPDFLRGYMEGSPSRPGNGRSGKAPAVRRSSSRVKLSGAESWIWEFRTAARAACGVSGGVVTAHETPGLADLTFTPKESLQLLASAYRAPARSAPRSASLIARFSRAHR